MMSSSLDGVLCCKFWYNKATSKKWQRDLFRNRQIIIDSSKNTSISIQIFALYSS